jgi:hypothetical protein
MKVALLNSITPSGKLAKIGALLKAVGYVLSFRALEAGRAIVSWYQVPKGAHLSSGKPRPVSSQPAIFRSQRPAPRRIGLRSPSLARSSSALQDAEADQQRHVHFDRRDDGLCHKGVHDQAVSRASGCQHHYVWEIGAGAWSHPPCSFVRESLDRPAIQLGGGLQILFGVGESVGNVIPPSSVFNEKWSRAPCQRETEEPVEV